MFIILTLKTMIRQNELSFYRPHQKLRKLVFECDLQKDRPKI